MSDDTSLDEAWQDAWMDFVNACAASLFEARQTNPWPDVPLARQAVVYLMTELWDRGFSSGELREAFRVAADDVERYSAGEC
jgi:hypothetical protein